MTRRLRPPIAFLAAGLLVGTLAACEPAPGPPGPTGPTPAPTSQFSLRWAKPVTDQKNISTSSPVVVDNNGAPFVVTGDLGGNLKTFDLATGAAKSGWSNVNAGFEIKAPLSSDGTNVYVPVGANGAMNWQFRNAESTMATPALADLYDQGSPQIIFSNDKGSSGSGDKYGATSGSSPTPVVRSAAPASWPTATPTPPRATTTRPRRSPRSTAIR